MNCSTVRLEKLKPTPQQERALDVVLWRCRTLYNTALDQRITAWQRCHVSVSRYTQEAELKEIREALPKYAAIHSHVLQDVLARLDKTYQAFFRRLKNGEKPGFPRFQGRTRFHSFTYKEFGNGARLDNGFLILSKIGSVAVQWSRPIVGTIKTVTISKEADGWYVAFSCADVPIQPLPVTGKETGIDVGLKVFLMTAEGEVTDNPRHYRKAEKALAKAQRRVSRRKKGSHRRRKAIQILARKHQHVRRQRSDFHHKTALALVRQYDVIYHEAIQPANLSRRPEPKPDGTGGYEHNGASHKAGLNKSIRDAGWSQFLSLLACQAEWAGKRVEAVNPAYTSQDCSGCGERVEKSLSVRTHVCTNCGLILDRDENAARNIQWLGQSLAGTRGATCGVEPRTRRALARAECQFLVIRTTDRIIVLCTPAAKVHDKATEQQCSVGLQWAAAHDHRFLLVDDAQLRAGHLLGNLKLLWKYSRLPVSPFIVGKSVEIVGTHPGSMRFIDLATALAPSGTPPLAQAPSLYALLYGGHAHMNSSNQPHRPTREEISRLPVRERRALIDRIRIRYPQWDEITEEIASCHQLQPDAAEPPGLFLVGHTRAGKSTILRYYANQFPLVHNETGNIQPVLYVSIPTNGSISDLTTLILDALGDPRADRGTTGNKRLRARRYIKDL